MNRARLVCVALVLVGVMAASASGQFRYTSLYEFKTPLPLDPGRTLVGLKVEDSQPTVNWQRRGLGVFAATAAGAGGAVPLDISSGFTVDVVVGPKEAVAMWEYNEQFPSQYLWTLQGWTTGHDKEPWFLTQNYGNQCFIANSTETGFGVPYSLPTWWNQPNYHGGQDGIPENGVLIGGDRVYHMASTMGNVTLPGDWTEVAAPGPLVSGQGMEAQFNCMAAMSSHWTSVFQISSAECTLPVAQQGSYENVNFALVASAGGNAARYVRIYAVYADGQELLWAFADDVPDGPIAMDNDGGEHFDVLYTMTHVIHIFTVQPPSLPPVGVHGGPYEVETTSPDGAYVQLDGTGSYDREDPSEPEAIVVAWEWDLNIYVDSNGDGDKANDVDATGPTPVCFFPVGTTRINLRVKDLDDDLWDVRRTTYVTVAFVQPTAVPPVAVANGPYVAQATSWGGACVSLDGSASFDPNNLEDPEAIVGWEWDLDLADDSDGDGDPANDVDAIGPTPIGWFAIGQTDISLRVLDANDGLWSDPDVTSVTVSEIEVAIDIRPGCEPNSINLGAHGVVPVAFLSDGVFNAAMIDPSTVTLRGEEFSDGLVKLRGKKNPEPMADLVDVDGDGDLDLVVHLEIERLAEHELSTVCELGALTYDGFVVSGSDEIRIVPID